MKKVIRHFNKVFQSLLLLATIVLLCSHDLYIKMDSYFLKPNQTATLSLYNGTFEKSENTISRDRMLDASILFNGQRMTMDSSQWMDKDSTVTQLLFTPVESATYVAGVSTKARNIALSADKFNDYLKHDGVLDMLAYRTENKLLDQNAVERYEKHVKAIYQVGSNKTEDWKTVLGYPIEFVPLENPYDKYAGDQLAIQLLVDGKPLANQWVFANSTKGSHQHSHEDETHSHEDNTHSHNHGDESHAHEHTKENDAHSHKHDDSDHQHAHGTETHTHETEAHSHGEEAEAGHTHTSGQQLRTNDNGTVTIPLSEEGIYYIRTIFMENVTDNAELTHRSKWATLTFEVTHKHDSTTHTHDDHEHEAEIPTWWFVVGSLVIIGLLFVVFRKNDE